MRTVSILVTVVGVVAVQACSDASRDPVATQPAAVGEISASFGVENGGPGRRIFLRDQCDPTDLEWVGGCRLPKGNVTVAEFQAAFMEHGGHPLWRFSPIATTVESGETLQIVNVGGRVHTFTRVAEFGGGVVPGLNGGKPTRRECQPPLVRILPEGTLPITFTGSGEQLFMCCFHPWMQSVIQVREEHGS
jgi:plastocyanin